ncbi:MAG: hypothetical protein WBI20_15135 [Burkholderiaceae bacterium]
MRADTVFLYLQRFNTLIPLVLVMLMAAAMGWATITDRGTFSKKTVNPPSQAETDGKEVLRIRASGIDTGPNNLVMKVVTSRKVQGYEGVREETRNMLFLKEESEKAVWLFSDQAQALTKIQVIKNEAGVISGIYLEAVARPLDKGGSKDAMTSIYLVSPDGSRLERILAGVDFVLSIRPQKNQLQVIYQKENAVRTARVSLPEFVVQSDRIIATLSDVGK